MRRRRVEHHASPGLRAQARRRPPTAGVAVSIGRAADRQVEWEGKLVAFDRTRAKVWLETKKPTPPDGSNVWLRFGPRHKESPVVGGMVWGTEFDGSITVLLSLTTREFQSLTNLVSALLKGETAAPSPEPEVRVPPRPDPEVPVATASPRAESGGVNLARQAEASAARGDYEEAWRLYSQALRAEPADVSLWYALGATASRLNQRAETKEASPPAARPSQPEATEVRLSSRALVSAGALAELAALTHVAEPMGEARKDRRAVKGKVTRRASEPAAALVPPPRSKPSGPSPVRQSEARVAQRDRMLEGSMTQDERERALLALVEEGHRVPPSRAELIAKVMELRGRGDKERSRTPKKTRR